MLSELRIRLARRRWLALPAVLALAGCAGTLPAITSGPDPADAAAAIVTPPYVPVTAGAVSHQPVEPKPWRDMNERVAPRGGRGP